MLLGAVFGVAIAVALSGLIALPTAKLSGMYVMVLTLGLQITLERTVFSRSFLTGGGQVIQVPRPKIFGISLDSDKAFYYFTLIVLVAVIFLLARFRDSRHGRAMTLVKTDRRGAVRMASSPPPYQAPASRIPPGATRVAPVRFLPVLRSPPPP